MKRPKQLPAVDRGSKRSASVPVGANVSASSLWSTDFWDTPACARGIVNTCPLYSSLSAGNDLAGQTVANQ
jgi:hypothetical protein